MNTNKGICIDCCDNKNCQMIDMLKEWKTITDEYGDNVKEIRPDLWEEYSIDQPSIKKGEVVWCPMFCEK